MVPESYCWHDYQTYWEIQAGIFLPALCIFRWLIFLKSYVPMLQFIRNLVFVTVFPDPVVDVYSKGIFYNKIKLHIPIFLKTPSDGCNKSCNSTLYSLALSYNRRTVCPDMTSQGQPACNSRNKLLWCLQKCFSYPSKYPGHLYTC